MKADNLKLLKNNNFNIPPFVTVTSAKNIDLSFSDSEFFAVRSSFGGEDGDKHSFAGQYKTVLNVRRKDVAAAVAEVLDSRNNAEIYSAASGANRRKGCVIIQEMIQADLSGVIFTANPNGILNETVVTAGIGCGDKIVNDSVETTSYFYNFDDKCWYIENGKEILSKKILDDILKLAEEAKKVLGKYLDIEFAVKDGVLYVLQARPITTLLPKKIIVLDGSNISESYPDITLPLTQSFVKDIYYRIFYNCLKRMSHDKKLVKAMQPYIKNMVTNVNGREYYVISNWYAFLSLLPYSRKIIPIWREMLGVEENIFCSPKIKTNFIQRSKILSSFVFYLIFAPSEMKKLKRRFNNNLPLYKKAASKNDIRSLMYAFDLICDDILSDWDITLINDMYAFIFTYLCKNGKNINNLSPESIMPVKAVNDLIFTYRKYGIDSPEYKKRKKRYLSLYGDRISGELKLETQTYRTCPDMLDAYVKSSVPIKTEKKIHQNRNFFEKCAAKGIKNRESSRLDRSRIFGLVRGIMLDIGKILVKDGRIEKKEDIFYLYIHEIRNIEKFSDKKLKNIISIRKQKYAGANKIPYFKRLVFADKVIEKNITCASISQNGNILYGNGVSRGKVTGEVVIVDDPLKTAAKDKIIVTRSTDPGWVFLIQNCKGIIAERGSLLSHTAIISRELEKPSLVNVKNALQILKNGMRVELDATNGRIRIL